MKSLIVRGCNPTHLSSLLKSDYYQRRAWSAAPTTLATTIGAHCRVDSPSIFFQEKKSREVVQSEKNIEHHSASNIPARQSHEMYLSWPARNSLRCHSLASRRRIWVEAGATLRRHRRLLLADGASRPGCKKTDGHWGLSGPGWAAEWNQGGESGFLSIACGADDDQVPWPPGRSTSPSPA